MTVSTEFDRYPRTGRFLAGRLRSESSTEMWSRRRRSGSECERRSRRLAGSVPVRALASFESFSVPWPLAKGMRVRI